MFIEPEGCPVVSRGKEQSANRSHHLPHFLQFLVVSHKDGFFNNANIIFRTKFVDGVSAVTRTVVQHADRVASGAVHGDELSQGKAARGGAVGARPRQALKDSNR